MPGSTSFVAHKAGSMLAERWRPRRQSASAAWAATSLAIGTRKGEQLT